MLNAALGSLDAMDWADNMSRPVVFGARRMMMRPRGHDPL
jgi:hypothetical protein